MFVSSSICSQNKKNKMLRKPLAHLEKIYESDAFQLKKKRCLLCEQFHEFIQLQLISYSSRQ